MSPRVYMQPPPDDELIDPPEGWRVEWQEADPKRERLAMPDEILHRKCRRPGCQWPVAWALLRRHGQGYAWWFYCADHNYGRRIEDGRLLYRRLVPERSDARIREGRRP